MILIMIYSVKGGKEESEGGDYVYIYTYTYIVYISREMCRFMYVCTVIQAHSRACQVSASRLVVLSVLYAGESNPIP
jgi:hypothetical protein